MARTARGLATKEAFREGARRVFARDGYLNSRLIDIAAEAGRSPGLLYQHYDGKEAILADLAADLNSKLQATVRAPFAAGLTPVEALHKALRGFWELYQEHLAELVGISQAALIDPAFAAQWKRIHRSATDLVTTGIQQAKQAGYCPDLDPSVAAEALVGMVEQACLHWMYRPLQPSKPPDPDTAIDTLWLLWTRAVYWSGPLPDGTGQGLPPTRQS